MTDDREKDPSLFGEYKKIGRSVFDELKSSGIRQDVQTDLRYLYEFYVDEEQRARLAKMGRFRRWLWQIGWLVQSLVSRLSPTRRVLVVVGIVLFLAERSNQGDQSSWQGPLALALLLLVLMMELRDKLLARDELEIGRAIQLSLLPQGPPQLNGWDIWFYSRPANDVGGDLVDAIELRPDEIAVVLADVAGKGLGAALLMSKLQATIRALATPGLPLSELGAQVNRILCRDGVEGRFATLVHLQLRAEDSRVQLLNAGHLPPVIVRRDGIDKLEPVALPIGVKPDEQFERQQVELAAGDVLVAYSDGVTEATDEAGAFLGEEAVWDFLRQHGQSSARTLGEGLIELVRTHSSGQRLADDLSAVVVRRV
jgi:hypothetical protein